MPWLVGTSGWQYRDWRGVLYPAGVPQRLWLEHYAEQFGTVENNNSFYRLPTREMFAAWAGEKAGHLKFNGHLLTRSPLSDLEETEMLRLGVEGKAAGWRTLRAVAERDSRLDTGQLDELLARADRQSDELESLRVRIAAQVLAGDDR